MKTLPSPRLRVAKEIAHEVFRNTNAVIGLIILGLIIVMAIFADQITPYDPIVSYPEEALQPPSLSHLMGTDDLGRDIFSRVIHGARVSLYVAFISTVLAICIGAPLGMLGGYFGGVIDIIISRITDMLFAIPDVLLALTVIAILGAGMNQLTLALAVAYTPIFMRLTRGVALKSRDLPYVEAARAIGEREHDIILNYILPNCIPPLIVQATLTFAYAVLAEAAFSFLALGVKPPTPSWGRMLSDARVFMVTAPWAALFPGIAIFITSMAFNLIGDGLRDAFDVRLRT